ncbi:MAG: glycosyltransferase family 1 protein, partial [Pyrinomonadaceae bacterium]
MKILYLTGGAGQMYCGSCLRDNALATELIARGQDVSLLPVYTPTLTDEPNVSEDRVFFGGISVYLDQYVPVFRKSPRWLDRVLDSRPMLQLASRRSI